MDDFGRSIEWLITLRNQLLYFEKIIKKSAVKLLDSNDSTFNRRDEHATNPKLSYIRDTYYTPSRNEKSKLPLFMYNVSTPESTTESNRSDQQQSDVSFILDNIQESSFVAEADKYGYRACTDGIPERLLTVIHFYK